MSFLMNFPRIFFYYIIKLLTAFNNQITQIAEIGIHFHGLE